MENSFYICRSCPSRCLSRSQWPPFDPAPGLQEVASGFFAKGWNRRLKGLNRSFCVVHLSKDLKKLGLFLACAVDNRILGVYCRIYKIVLILRIPSTRRCWSQKTGSDCQNRFYDLRRPARNPSISSKKNEARAQMQEMKAIFTTPGGNRPLARNRPQNHVKNVNILPLHEHLRTASAQRQPSTHHDPAGALPD